MEIIPNLQFAVLLLLTSSKCQEEHEENIVNTDDNFANASLGEANLQITNLSETFNETLDSDKESTVGNVTSSKESTPNVTKVTCLTDTEYGPVEVQQFFNSFITFIFNFMLL